MTEQEQRMQEWLDLRAKNPNTYVMPFVMPARGTDVVRRQIAQLDINVSGPHIVSNTSATDRAEAFVIETSRLALYGALLAVLVAWVGLDWPLLTSAMLLLFGAFFVLVWLLVWLVHRALTPEALAWFHAVQIWRYIRGR